VFITVSPVLDEMSSTAHEEIEKAEVFLRIN